MPNAGVLKFADRLGVRMLSLESKRPPRLVIVVVVDGDATILSASNLKPCSNCAKTWVMVNRANCRPRECYQYAYWAMEVSRLCVLEHYKWFNSLTQPSTVCVLTRKRRFPFHRHQEDATTLNHLTILSRLKYALWLYRSIHQYTKKSVEKLMKLMEVVTYNVNANDCRKWRWAMNVGARTNLPLAY